MEFKDRLRTAMNDNHLNARELSKKCGLSEASISRYLLGQMEPKVTAIRKMAEALHVDPVWLSGIEAPVPDFTIETQKMSLLIECLNNSEKTQVENFIKFIISNRGNNE